MKRNLYLIHGWGMNKAVWQTISGRLAEHFELHLLDIPGYGDAINQLPTPYNLASISQQVAKQIQKDSIVLGWSLGGLIAQQISISQPEKIAKLICVASTPCFQEQINWPGIKTAVLDNFQQQLTQDYQKTIERFLAIQTIGSDTARQDVKYLKQLLMTYPTPNPIALAEGLTILAEADLRKNLSSITAPTYRFYGRLDSLVPKDAIDNIKDYQPNSQSVVFKKASHAPFISHPEEFIQSLLSLLNDNK